MIFVVRNLDSILCRSSSRRHDFVFVSENDSRRDATALVPHVPATLGGEVEEFARARIGALV